MNGECRSARLRTVMESPIIKSWHGQRILPPSMLVWVARIHSHYELPLRPVSPPLFSVHTHRISHAYPAIGRFPVQNRHLIVRSRLQRTSDRVSLQTSFSEQCSTVAFVEYKIFNKIQQIMQIYRNLIFLH